MPKKKSPKKKDAVKKTSGKQVEPQSPHLKLTVIHTVSPPSSPVYSAYASRAWHCPRSPLPSHTRIHHSRWTLERYASTRSSTCAPYLLGSSSPCGLHSLCLRSLGAGDSEVHPRARRLLAASHPGEYTRKSERRASRRHDRLAGSAAHRNIGGRGDDRRVAQEEAHAGRVQVEQPQLSLEDPFRSGLSTEAHGARPVARLHARAQSVHPPAEPRLPDSRALLQ